MSTGLRASCAITGVGLSRLGSVPGCTHVELAAEATARAAADAGVAIRDIDAVMAANDRDALASVVMSEYLGLRPRVAEGTHTGGSSAANHLQWAALALQAGLCDCALIVYGSNMRSAAGGFRIVDPSPYEDPYRPRNPASSYALAAARHMHEFGTTQHHLAEVAVAARRWAQLNPIATERTPLSIEEVLSARRVVDPLGLKDCCLVSDGAGALIVQRADRARHGPKPPVFLLGVAAAQWHNRIANLHDLTTTAATESGRRAYAMAGCAASDVDVAQLYDAFTINPILFLEDLGFCAKGEGGSFVEGGAIGPGGRFPVNTNGGGLSCVHPGMYGVFMLIEAVQQLRGAAGERQVLDAEIALCHANGGALSSEVTAILGGPSTA